jgi:hypothetical protein
VFYVKAKLLHILLSEIYSFTKEARFMNRDIGGRVGVK